MAASLAGAPSAQAQTAAFVTSGMGGGASSTARLAAFQMSQQGAIQAHQTTLATLESRVAALEGGGGGVDIQPFHLQTAFAGHSYACPTGYTLGACWCDWNGKVSPPAGACGSCGGGSRLFGFCKK